MGGRPGLKPSIFQVGVARELPGGGLYVAGWGLSECARRCRCHRHPMTGSLALRQSALDGSLGLFCFAPAGCDCCEPWTPEELAAVLRDLADIEALAAL